MARRGRGCDAWQLLRGILAAERSRLPVIAAGLGLSQAQCQVLQLLDPEAPVAMCRVAEALDCDPSNVTGIVDRLQAQGLVERRVCEGMVCAVQSLHQLAGDRPPLRSRLSDFDQRVVEDVRCSTPQRMGGNLYFMDGVFQRTPHCGCNENKRVLCRGFG